jgi:DNA replication and repair protein RecF
MNTVFLQKLSILLFKNIREAQLDFSANITCFYGDNGQGKTNLLDAIYYLAHGKSYFNPSDSHNILFEESFFMLQGKLKIAQQQENIHCGVKKGHKKVLKRNDKEYERLADHIGLIPLVMISPYDTDLIKEGSEVRRKFIDGIISQYNPGYLQSLLQYQKIIRQRNALLKSNTSSGFRATIEILNEQLETYLKPIAETRLAFLKDFTPVFEEFYKTIASQSDEPSLEFKPSLNNEEPYLKQMENALQRDSIIQYTTKGVHKDDLLFLLGGKPIKKFGSQGQQKTYLVALRLAQYKFLEEKTGKKPLLLLDDVFDKLDHNRVTQLMHIMHQQNFGQTFITHTEKEVLQSIFEKENWEENISYFQVANGEVSSK